MEIDKYFRGYATVDLDMIHKNVEHPYAEKIYEFMISSKQHATDWIQYSKLFKIFL